MKFISLIVLFFTCSEAFTQGFSEDIETTVLEKNITDSVYVFGKWNKDEGTETHLNYLGEIKTSQGNYKIMTSIWYWGQSKRATSRILVFNDENKYLGNYYLKLTTYIPNIIENNELVFFNKDVSCDSAIQTRLSFSEGIPEYFFRECTKGHGDLCYFDKE